MKVLLSAVGGRDPFPTTNEGADRESPGPVLQAIDRVRPDAIYLLPTSSGEGATLSNAKALRGEILTGVPSPPRVEITPLPLADQTDYVTVVREFRRVVQAVRADYDDDTEWHVCLSAGAPQFRLAWALLVLGGELPATCWESRAPAFPGERVWQAPIHMLDEPAQRTRWLHAWNRCDFGAAEQTAREWSRRAPEPEQRARAAAVADLMQVLRMVDAVNWHAAAERLRSCTGGKAGRHLRSVVGEQIAAQAIALQAIDPGPSPAHATTESCWNLADLYHNARRRVRAGLYVDALARYRRIVEGTLYLALRERGCTIAREDRGYARLPQSAERLLAQAMAERVIVRHHPTKEQLVYLDLPLMLLLVREMYGLDRTLVSQLQGYADHRNQTIAAHGMLAVEKRLAEDALDRAAVLLERVAPLPGGLDSYPFSLTELDRMTERLATLLKPPVT
jgi:hypothetical protein